MLWSAAILLIAGIAWLVSGRFLVRFVDVFSTKPLEALETKPFRFEGDRLLLGKYTPDFTRPDGFRADIRLETQSKGRLMLLAGERAFPLGRVTGPGNFSAEAGDQVECELRASWVAWPTPFEMNFMTGHSPSYRRHSYYRIVWKKASGQTLELVWRFQQGFYPRDGWASPWGIESGVTGLIRFEIRP